MISLAIIMVFLTTIITLFFNSLSNAWKDLESETKDIYIASIQNFIKEVKKDFVDNVTALCDTQLPYPPFSLLFN